MEDTALIWMLTSAKKQKIPVHAKYYHKEIMSSIVRTLREDQPLSETAIEFALLSF